MIKPIVKDVMFLGQVSEPSTKEDAQVARDLRDTLAAHRDGFVDSNLIIQKKAGAKLSEIIEKYGVDSFMMQEETALLSIYAFNTVIATGGSAVYSEIAMNQLAKTSRIVYLKVGLDDLKEGNDPPGRVY